MHKDIVILTKQTIDFEILDGLDYCIIQEPTFESAFSFQENGDILTCDYIITDTAYKELSVLTEDKKILANHHFETSVDNVFVIGQVKSNLTIQEQLQTIINYLKNPE